MSYFTRFVSQKAPQGVAVAMPCPPVVLGAAKVISSFQGPQHINAHRLNKQQKKELT